MSPSDHDLLRDYACDGSQAAFAALVERHLDLVYSAARRQVKSPELAEEVAQSVFADLARQAPHLTPATPVVAWLHVVSRRTAIDVVRRESRRQAREQQAVEIAEMKTNPPAWDAVEPLLDEAVESLNETDRAAILLRYFENKSLRDIGATLGASEDAAQKRVSRAVEQLRTFFLRRGIAVSAAGLASDLSAHALATAPAHLGATIASAATAASAASATHAIAMTTIQKNSLAAALALVLGTGIYEATLFASQRAELDALQQETTNLSASLRRSTQQADATARQFASARGQLDALQSAASTNPAFADGAAEAEMRAWLERSERLKRYAIESGKSIPELALLSNKDWLERAQNMDRYRDRNPLDEALRGARGTAGIRFSMYLGQASRDYVKAHDGQLPNDTRELLPYFKDNTYFKAADVTEEMLARYTLRYTGTLNDVPANARGAVIIPLGSPDEEHDQRFISGPGGSRITTFADVKEDTEAALRFYAKAHDGSAPATAAELLPYFNPPLSEFRQNKFLQQAPALLHH